MPDSAYYLRKWRSVLASTYREDDDLRKYGATQSMGELKCVVPPGSTAMVGKDQNACTRFGMLF
jgi:hypothetical protein